MKLLYYTIIIMVFLLFFGGPGYETHRILKELWDMGHLFLFAGISYIVSTKYFLNKNASFKYFLRLILLMTIFGLLIEVLQILIGRDFELKDIAADMLGVVIGFSIATYFNLKYIFNKKYLSILSIIILTLIGSINLISVVIDEVYMRKEFPRLASYSKKINLTRWDINAAKIALSEHESEQGTPLLAVKFLPAKYPDISLQHFLRDWSGYKKFEFSLYNKEQAPIFLELKIYDKAHIQNGYKYNDRFNKELLLHPGWNHISISLDEIFDSPKERKMDMTKIKSVSLFMKNVTVPITFFLDNLKLI